MSSAQMATQPAGRHAAHRAVHAWTFGGSVRSEWCKMWSAMSTYVLLVLCVVFFAVNSLMIGWLLSVMASQGSMPIGMGDVWTTASAGAGDGMLIVGILGVMAMTSEYSSQSIITSLTVNPRRVMFMNAKALVLALVTFLASFVGVLVAWGCAWLMVHGAFSSGAQAMPAALPWVTLLGVPAAMAFTAVMAMGFGAMLRSTVGGVLCVVGLFTLLPSILQFAQLLDERFAWIASVNNCLPSKALEAFVGAGAQSFSNNMAAVEMVGSTRPFQPTWGWAGAILVAWTVAIYAAGVAVTAKRDVK